MNQENIRNIPITAQGPAKVALRKITHLLLHTQDICHTMPLRLSLAAVMWPHGAQKLFGWFGGHGLEGTLAFLRDTMGIPTPLAVAVILLEFFAPLLLVLGLGTRMAAAALAGVMAGAMILVQWPHGFFMNWSGTQAGEGIQFSLLFIAVALALVGSGGGSLSVDRKLTARFESSAEQE